MAFAVVKVVVSVVQSASMTSSQSAGNVSRLAASHQVDSLLEDEELYTSAAARYHSGVCDYLYCVADKDDTLLLPQYNESDSRPCRFWKSQF